MNEFNQQRFKKEDETQDLEYFLESYQNATWNELQVLEVSERPDFICEDLNGLKYGVELTMITRDGKRLRKYDNRWTFGKPNNYGYMLIVSEVVHRIVATAFHGIPPTHQHIVDHIDTNRKNNQPENLRWVTRLENILLNPITCRRVEIAYGSIENFLRNPNQPIPEKLDQNFEWMRSVTKKEADDSHNRGQSPNPREAGS